jgi:3-deoxy-D-manno-octulosonic-acid transferase
LTAIDSVGLQARLALFRLLEAASHLRNPPRAPLSAGATSGHGLGRSLWLYVTTIGELNAIEPLIGPLLAALGEPALTLISNHGHYADAYQKKYPAARVEVIDGTSAQARALARRCSPLLLVVAEIPCLLHDAPCRFSYATLRAARDAGAAAVLVNGWLYGYEPPSRMDRIERRLFARDYVRGFDLMLVQTEAVRERLLAAGADPARVEVTGNLKYDAMHGAASALESGVLGQALRAYDRGPVVVAGSVTETDDQRQMLEAFCELRAVVPDARLVLAPRHPENRERMAALEELLCRVAIGHAWRSRTGPGDLLTHPVLVLDTMGELRECYAAAAAAFVGVDHNVLEPLMFGRPTYVSGRWDATYPSYPVYLQMLDAGALTSVAEIRQLGSLWVRRFSDGETAPGPELGPLLEAAARTVPRDLAALRRRGLLPRLPDGHG